MKDLSELTSRCIHCGLCLEACPTFVLTADETQSPRGRIHLARQAMDGRLEWGTDIEQPLATCLGCRACETACPSGVRFGEILEYARERLETEDPHRLRRLMSSAFTNSSVLRTQILLSKLWPGSRVPPFVSLPLAGRWAEANIPKPQGEFVWPAMDESKLPPVRGQVYMPEGCVMSVLFPRVNEATRRLLRRVGFTVRAADAGCCGALHAHMGFLEDAAKRAADNAAAFSEDLPIVVNAAGCGSTMKEYGVHAEALRAFSDRVRDVSEFLLEEGLEETLSASARLELEGDLSRRLSPGARAGRSGTASAAVVRDSRPRAGALGGVGHVLRERGHLQSDPAGHRSAASGPQVGEHRAHRRVGGDRGEPRMPRVDRAGGDRARPQSQSAAHGRSAGVCAERDSGIGCRQV